MLEHLKQNFLCNKRTHCFSRVLPGQNYNCLFLDGLNILNRFDSDHWNGISHYCRSYRLDRDFIAAFCSLKQNSEVLNSIRHGVRELHFVVFRCKIILKTQSLIALIGIILIAEVILLVKDVKSFPSPHNFAGPGALFRTDARLHTHAIQRLRFVLCYLNFTKLTMLNCTMKLFL